MFRRLPKVLWDFSAYIFHGNFINNTSPRGGGVNFFESFENVIFNGEFTANSAINGGAIAAVEGIIKDVSFAYLNILMII